MSEEQGVAEGLLTAGGHAGVGDGRIKPAGPPLTVERVRDVPMPRYATPGAAAFDLVVGAFLSNPHLPWVHSTSEEFANAQRVTLEVNKRVWIGTGIAVHIPEDYGLMIVPRSGLGAKNGVVLANGTAVIDSDYRSEIKLALLNQGDDPVMLKQGKRVAQAWLLSAPQAWITEGEVTETGRGGFGSTDGDQ